MKMAHSQRVHSSTFLSIFINSILVATFVSITFAAPIMQSTKQSVSSSSSSSSSSSPSSPSPSPSPSSSIPPSLTQSVTYASKHVRGVWPVTKVASLFGPTVAIFLYDRAHNVYEQYQPFISAAFIDFAQHLRAAVQSPPYVSRPLVWLSSMPMHDPSDSNPRVTAIANEVIRLTNVRLREHAVISRIQMDDDQFEFSKSLSQQFVKDSALRVMKSVLTNGSGRYLEPEEKIAVHALIASSVY